MMRPFFMLSLLSSHTVCVLAVFLYMLFAAARWSLLAHSGQSPRRNSLSAFGQERTLF